MAKGTPNTSTKQARAGLYCRISKDRLAEGLGVERQEKDLRRLARDRGWTISEVFVDNDVSASNTRVQRPAFERMLAAVEAGHLDVIAAWDDDRLVRRPAELERVFTVLDAAGATYATMSNTVDVGTGDGMLVARIRGAVAAEEVRKMATRLRSKHAELADRGLPSGGGHRAYGYDRDGITVLEHEAAVLRDAAARYLAGEGFRVIARSMNAAGARTSTGREWTDATLRNTLVNPRYAGLRTHRGEVVGPAAWPAILDQATHERIVAATRNRRRPGPKAPRTHLLSGLVRCSRCGHRMHAAPVGDRYGYRCHKRPGTTACGGMSISATPVDEAVVAMVLYRLGSPAVADAVAGRTSERTTEAELLDEIGRHEARLEEAATMFADGMITAAQLRKITTDLRGKIDSTRGRLSSNERGARLAGVVADADDIAARWDELPFERRHAVIASLIDHIEVQPGVRGSKNVDVEARLRVRWIA